MGFFIFLPFSGPGDTFITARHEAPDLVRRRMKIMLSITSSYCRGLIYQAQPGDSHTGFDESNPYNRIYILYPSLLRIPSRVFAAYFHRRKRK